MIYIYREGGRERARERERALYWGSFLSDSPLSMHLEALESPMMGFHTILCNLRRHSEVWALLTAKPRLLSAVLCVWQELMTHAPPGTTPLLTVQEAMFAPATIANKYYDNYDFHDIYDEDCFEYFLPQLRLLPPPSPPQPPHPQPHTAKIATSTATTAEAVHNCSHY